MTWFGVILVACGAGVLAGLHGGVAQSAGVALLVVGVVLVLAGVLRAVFRVRRKVRGGGLRYTDREDFRDGVPADYRTNRGKIFAMVVVLVYLFSPVDLAVLELLLPIGVVGDTGAIAWLLLATGKETARHHQARQARRALTEARARQPSEPRSG